LRASLTVYSLVPELLWRTCESLTAGSLATAGTTGVLRAAPRARRDRKVLAVLKNILTRIAEKKGKGMKSSEKGSGGGCGCVDRGRRRLLGGTIEIVER
jgi:hypothetical protein